MTARHNPSARRVLASALAALVASALLASCADKTAAGPGATGGSSTSPSQSPTPTPKVTITSNVKSNATAVRVNRVVSLTATDGTFRRVVVHSLKGENVRGGLSADKTSWTASGRLEPGRSYVVQAVAEDADGTTRTYSSRFSTAKLSLAQQTFPSVSPLSGSTVGVGMPVMIHFDVPVTNRRNFQKHMTVSSSAGQRGSFYWIDNQNVHYRPKHFWKANSTITVNVDVNSVAAGNGIYGQESRKVSFHVGRSMVSHVDMNTHQMRVFRDGRLLRTIPITTGAQPKFTTRSGIKVIVEKYRRKRINSETIGSEPNSPAGYTLAGVEYAMRVTYSGEFVHAAPWSVGSQGHANVSHGCTGMSTSNAAWLYNLSIPGDVVEYTGTSKQMTLTNGYGDWNLSWGSWEHGSAL
jgi:lipoprotein-anchoring transpeptidase ErfK/SrfK